MWCDCQLSMLKKEKQWRCPLVFVCLNKNFDIWSHCLFHEDHMHILCIPALCRLVVAISWGPWAKALRRGGADRVSGSSTCRENCPARTFPKKREEARRLCLYALIFLLRARLWSSVYICTTHRCILAVGERGWMAGKEGPFFFL